jgi:hypothetical protein
MFTHLDGIGLARAVPLHSGRDQATCVPASPASTLLASPASVLLLMVYRRRPALSRAH